MVDHVNSQELLNFAMLLKRRGKTDLLLSLLLLLLFLLPFLHNASHLRWDVNSRMPPIS